MVWRSGRVRRVCSVLAGAAAVMTTTGALKAQNTVRPMYGNIAPFYGHIDPFWGNITPFYGNIAPFYGNITPFWGNIAPFWGNITPFTQPTDAATLALYGTKNDPFWGTGPLNPYTSASKYGIAYSQVGAFWKTEASNWQTVQTAWGRASTQSDYQALATLIQASIINPAGTFWGGAIKKSAGPSATANTYLSKLIVQAGITFNADGTINASSLAGVSETQRAVLFLGLYDSLMTLTGTGHVDWWMGATGWSPALAATEGTTPTGGVPPTIGMLDFAISADNKHLSKQITQYGSTVFNDGHGAAVGSLIMGSVDGSGVMGVMPAGSVNVIVYDPYDSTGTTNWTDVGTGVAALNAAIFKGKTVPVGVLNASLGVPGWTLNPGWNSALTTAGAHGHDLVIAAGNDGVTQTQNVAWNFATNPTIILVGSVGVDGTISNFSNRPGEACLIPVGGSSACTEANKLKYRFIVAPGELILVSDGKGGFVRQSGTSLAAPLVSGAIALLQNRWPWLSKYPDETAQIILQSATKLGTNPGADAVYGAGELNIAASQSPLNWRSLAYYPVVNGKASLVPQSFFVATMGIRVGNQAVWNANNVSYSLIETIGNTHRDFQIPLSSKLVGTMAKSEAGGQYYQSYLTSALLAQAGKFSQLAGSAPSTAVFGFGNSGAPSAAFGGLVMRTVIERRSFTPGFRADGNLYTSDNMIGGENFALRFGTGQGAAALDAQSGFGFRSDYEVGQGGASPYLGLASGGAYLNASYLLAPGVSVSIGSTSRDDRRDLASLGLAIGPETAGLRRYRARAEQIGMGYAVSPRLSLHAAATILHEDAAALGIQSLDPANLKGGSTTTGMTIGVDFSVTKTLLLSASGTAGTTRLAGGTISTRSLGLLSTAGEIALTKARLFGRSDRIRFAVSKPLQVDAGRLHFASVGVVDRDTGDLGLIDQSFNPTSGRLPVAGEIMYGHSLAGGKAAVSLFGRAQIHDALNDGGTSYASGAQVQWAF
ncbi:S8 family serine peptidase [Sphingomonas sp. MAH-6]|nr:S8 family serine peptidase [Sphingomonas chungangi]